MMIQKSPVFGWVNQSSNGSDLRNEIDSVFQSYRPSVAKKLAGRIRSEEHPNLKRIRVAVFRTFSIEVFQDLITLAFYRCGAVPDFYWVDFDTFESELLPQDSSFKKAHAERGFDFIIFAWRLKEIIPDLWKMPVAAELDGHLKRSVDRLGGLLEEAAKVAPVLCFPLNDHGAESPLAQSRTLQSYMVSSHHAFLAKWCLKNPLKAALIDLNSRRSGSGSEQTFFDRKSEAFSAQPYSPHGQVHVSAAIAESALPWLRPSAKVLVLDADNTLWGGIIGEDGLNGIQIGDGFPGNLYRKLQTSAKLLKANGVLLAMASKNDEAAVQSVFDANPDMPLSLKDFSARRVNWNDKAANIKDMARELNLGLSSFVFIDDSDFERANVRAMLPEVLVPETPSILDMIDFLETGLEFLGMPLTAEDAARNQDYEASQLREELKNSASSMDEFLESLELEARIEVWSKDNLPRIFQMLHKTNQFNLTTRRHSLSHLEQWLGMKNKSAWILRTRDRFADQGIVGCAIAEMVSEETWNIDTLLLSCRALGRGFETAFLHHVLKELKNRGAAKVSAEFIPSGKNDQVKDFYQKHGARVLASDEYSSKFEFDLNEGNLLPELPKWVRILVNEA